MIKVKRLSENISEVQEKLESLIETHPKDTLPEFVEVLKEDLEKAKAIPEMP